MLAAVGLRSGARLPLLPARARQRRRSIIIAMALINAPQLVIADDATNGLDVTVQRQVLDLMTDLVHRQHASMLMITHDLGVVAQYCKRATVMYAGQAVEVAETDHALFDNPCHPYTKAARHHPGSGLRTRETAAGSPTRSCIAANRVLPGASLSRSTSEMQTP